MGAGPRRGGLQLRARRVGGPRGVDEAHVPGGEEVVGRKEAEIDLHLEELHQEGEVVVR